MVTDGDAILAARRGKARALQLLEEEIDRAQDVGYEGALQQQWARLKAESIQSFAGPESVINAIAMEAIMRAGGKPPVGRGPGLAS